MIASLNFLPSLFPSLWASRTVCPMRKEDISISTTAQGDFCVNRTVVLSANSIIISVKENSLERKKSEWASRPPSSDAKKSRKTCSLCLFQKAYERSGAGSSTFNSYFGLNGAKAQVAAEWIGRARELATNPTGKLLGRLSNYGPRASGSNPNLASSRVDPVQ